MHIVQVIEQAWRRFDERLGLDMATDYAVIIRIRCLVVFSGLIGGLLCVYGLQRLVTEGAPTAPTLITFSAAVFILAVPIAVWLTRQVHGPALALIGFSMVAINLVGYINGGLSSPGMAYLVLTCAFSAVFWGLRGGIIVLIVSILTVSLQIHLAQSGLLPEPTNTDEQRRLLTAFIYIMIAVELILLVFTFSSVFTRVAGQLDRSRRQNRLVLDSMDQGFAVYDSQLRLQVWSRRFTELLGANPALLRSGQDHDGGVPIHVFAEDGEEVPASPLAALCRQLRDDTARVTASTDPFVRSGVNGLSLEVLGKRLPDGGLLTTYTDITEQSRQRRRIEDLALKDTLTGLSNRLHFQICLEEAIKLAERQGRLVALCLLDLDRFKPINDVHGHLVGDEVLKVIAGRILATVRGGDLVARLGGDEFAIVLSGLDQEEMVVALMNRLVTAISAPIDMDGTALSVGTSIGISYFPRDGETPDTLFRHADMALYEAKDQGRGMIRAFDTIIDEKIRRRTKVDQELRSAIANNELCLYFQPQIDIDNTGVVGIEALLRWNHPERGLLTPDQFLDVAETSDLIQELGQWTLEEGMRQARTFQRQGFAFGKLAVNLSPRQFRAHSLPNVLRTALTKTGVDPNVFELEITEDAVSDDPEMFAASLAEIRAMDVDISIDDFGTGYSSLAYLRSLPVTCLKIDRSFVRDATHDDNAASIIEAIIRMAHSLGLTVLAEGVETMEQLAFLKQLGCDALQGYLICKPVSAAELERWLAERQTAQHSVKQLQTRLETAVVSAG